MTTKRARGLFDPRKAVLLLTGALLLGSSPFPGGCGSNVAHSKTYVNEGCDTIANGKAPPGCGGATGSSSTSGATSTSSTGTGAFTGQPSANCPGGFDCGNGYCCPAGHPACCADSQWCGTDSAACSGVDDPTGGSNISGGSNSSGGAGTICNTQSPDPCFSVQYCEDTDTSTCWFTFAGQRYSCASCSDITGCDMAVSNAGIASCNGSH